MLMRHPSFARLREYALEELHGHAGPAVGRHLMECAACRGCVQTLREFVAVVREPGASAPLLFETIAARIAAGEHVALPLEQQQAGGPTPGAAGEASAATGRLSVRRIAGAAAILAALVMGTISIAVSEAGAESSKLWITPEAPRAGQTLTLRYRATSRLAGEDRLIVRARYARPGMAPDARTVVLGELHRAGGNEYSGSVELPDSAVYAVLAIEDPAARFVDDHGEQWDVLVHGADGRPLLPALHRRYLDASRRNTRISDDVLRAMIELYPDDPAALYFYFGQKSLALSMSAVDSLRVAHRGDIARLESASRTGAGLDGVSYWYLIMYASLLGENDARDRLRTELIARYPEHPAAMHQAATLASAQHRGDIRSYLAHLDSLWRIAPHAAVAGFWSHAWQTAQQTGEREILLRWAERIEAVMPEAAAAHGMAMIGNPATRDVGMRRLRAAISGESVAAVERPLSQDRAEHDAARSRVTGTYLVALGRALVDEGEPRAALDTLSRALETGWNATLFRAVGDARLLLADTVGALESYARFAADPNTPTVFADSLRAWSGAYTRGSLRGSTWDAAVESARDELRRELLGRSMNRPPLRSQLRLTDTAGRNHRIALDDASGVTVVAFWSRYCPPSRRDLPRLDSIARELTTRGVRVIAVTDESDGEWVAAFLDENGYSLTTYLDPERDAHLAFDNRTSPYYVVLDARGRIRFTSHNSDDLVRHVAVLSGTGP